MKEAKLPLVSIIIPVYKVEKYISTSLCSALNQSYRNIEYVIVNDCSPDNSMILVNDIISREENRKKKFNIVNLEKNEGLSNARNCGLNVAEGEYVFFMDSDDQISYDCIELHMKSMMKYNVDFTDGNIEIKGKGKNNFVKYGDEIVINSDGVLESYFLFLHITSCNKLFRKDFLLKNKLYFKKGMLYEDMLWMYKVCMNTCNFVTVPFVSYYYFVHAGSITTQNNSKNHSLHQFTSFIELIKTMHFLFLKRDGKISKLQKRWLGKTILIVRGRLLDAPLSIREKCNINKEVNKFNDGSVGMLKLINSLPYPLFQVLFKIPNIIFRKFRR